MKPMEIVALIAVLGAAGVGLAFALKKEPAARPQQQVPVTQFLPAPQPVALPRQVPTSLPQGPDWGQIAAGVGGFLGNLIPGLASIGA